MLTDRLSRTHPDHNPRPNPYPGPRPFGCGEKLYGRGRETAELLDLLIAERIVLLCSPSGAGKTSLVQAALIPELAREGYRILPVMRPGLASGATGQNRYVLSLLLSLEKDLPAAQQTPLAELAGLTLAGYLQQRWPLPQDAGWHGDVLIFDQFEEILTADPTDRAAKLACFEQIGGALRDRDRWALFSMREEYVAALDPYVQPLPARFDKGRRYRLDLLGPDAACAAIQGPAADQMPAVTFTDAAAEKLVADLRRAQVQQPDGTIATTLGPHIEPVQLQVVCRRLWAGLAADDTTIDVDDLAAVGDVDAALRGYYADTVSDAAQGGVRERVIREWVTGQLITEGGFRGQVLKGAARSPAGAAGLDNAAIARLEDAHLVRSEQRRGATWFELAHDRLIAPVRADNATWFDANLSALQRQAALWEAQKRPEGLLLRDQDLVSAEAWAAEHVAEMVDVERDFLAACRAACTAAEERHRQALRIRRLQTGIIAGVIGVVTLAAIAGFILFFNQMRATRLALSRQLALQSANQLDNQYDLALLLSLAASQAADTAEARGGLLTALEHGPQLLQFMRDAGDQVSAVAFSPDGSLLATAGASSGSGIVSLWNVGWDGMKHRSTLLRWSSAAVAVAFSPDGSVLAAGCEDGTLHLLAMQAGASERTWPAHGSRVNSIAFSPDGKRLASAGKSEVILWDLPLRQLQPVGSPLVSGEPVYSLAFDPASGDLAVGYADGAIRLWDVAGQQSVVLAGPGEGEPANGLAFSPDGAWLAAGGAGGTVTLYDLINRQPRYLTGPAGAVEDVAFSPDGGWLAAANRDQSIRVWHLAAGLAASATLDGHAGWVMGVAFHPNGPLLASAGFDGNVILWDVMARSRLGRPLTGPHDDEVWAVALSPDNRAAASTGKDGRVVLWDLATGQGAEIGRHTDAARAVAFSPDGAVVASAGHDGYVRRWDISGAQPVALEPLLHAADQWASGVAFSPDGKRLASAGFDKTVKVWDLTATPPVSRTLVGHAGEIWSVAFSPDGKRLASGDDQGRIIIWDAARGQAQDEPLDGKEAILSVAFSPDGKRLASAGGGENRFVIVWDIATGEAVTFLARQTAAISGVAFGPDGNTLASSSHDGTIVLWDVATGQPIGQPLRLHTNPVNGVAFSPDGRVLASASDDRTVGAWDMAVESWQARACSIANRSLTLQEGLQYPGAPPVCTELEDAARHLR